MIQEEVPHFLKFNSETLTDTNTEHNISLQLKELTQANIFSVAEKQQYPLVMSCQSVKLLKVPPFAILNLQLETKDLTLDALEHMPPLLDIPMIKVESE